MSGGSRNGKAGGLWDIPIEEIPDRIADGVERIRQDVRDECAAIALRSAGRWRDEGSQLLAERVAEKIANAIRESAAPMRWLRCSKDHIRLTFDGYGEPPTENWSCPKCFATYRWMPEEVQHG